MAHKNSKSVLRACAPDVNKSNFEVLRLSIASLDDACAPIFGRDILWSLSFILLNQKFSFWACFVPNITNYNLQKISASCDLCGANASKLIRANFCKNLNFWKNCDFLANSYCFIKSKPFLMPSFVLVLLRRF